MLMIQHSYECLAKGHEGGSRTFQAAPPEWFAEKGISTPKNCPDCRAWVKAQTDEMKACESCGAKFRVTAKSKISHFKKTGPYVPERECFSCREGNRPEKSIGRPQERRRLEDDDKRKNAPDFTSLAHGLEPKSRPIMTQPSFYTENRMRHLAHHIPGSQYDLTHEGKSPSAFAQGSSVEHLLATAQEMFVQTSTDTVREYRDGNRIVRVTYLGDDAHLEISVLSDLGNNAYGLVTTYDNVMPGHIVRQSWYNRR